MSQYEYSRINGSYSGLSLYHGLGDGRGKGRDKRRRNEGSSKARSEILTQKAINTEKKAAALEQKGGAALTAGDDDLAKMLMAKAESLQKKAHEQKIRAEALKLPYTDDPLLPKAIVDTANAAAVDTPMAIANQTAPDVAPNMNEILSAIATQEPVQTSAASNILTTRQAQSTRQPIRYMMPPVGRPIGVVPVLSAPQSAAPQPVIIQVAPPQAVPMNTVVIIAAVVAAYLLLS